MKEITQDKLLILFKNSLGRLKIEFNADPLPYLLVCKYIKESFKYNNTQKTDFYLNILIKRNLTDSNQMIDIIEKATKINAVTLDKLILVYGEEWGVSKWNQYKNVQAKTNTFEYKQEKYGMTEEQFADYNKSRAVTVENLVAKHGIIKGTEIFDSYVEKQKETKSREYYSEKYGDEAWEELCKSKAHTIDNYIARYGSEEIAIEKLEEFFSRRVVNDKGMFSGASQEFFKILDERLGDVSINSLYANKNHEYAKYSKMHRKIFMYDYVIPEIKFCIEFNGDYYHANPNKYNSNDYITIKEKTAQQIWDYDKEKNQALTNLGYNVIVVWEDEYRNNVDKIVERVCNEIKKRN